MKRPAVLGPRLVTSSTPGRRCGTRQCFGARVLSCRVAVDVERGDAGARSARCRRSGAAPRRSPQKTGDAPPRALRRRRRGGRGLRRGRRKPGCRGDLAARARGSQVSNGMMIVPFGWSSCTNFWEPCLSAVTRREDNCECGEEGGSKSCGWLCDHTSPPRDADNGEVVPTLPACGCSRLAAPLGVKVRRHHACLASWRLRRGVRRLSTSGCPPRSRTSSLPVAIRSPWSLRVSSRLAF